jgi:hypothetical protein
MISTRAIAVYLCLFLSAKPMAQGSFDAASIKPAVPDAYGS